MSVELTPVEDKIVGSIVGLGIGDALGVPAEFRRRGSFREITDYRGGGDYAGLIDGIPPGYWTDDTSMALCLADSLIATRGYDGNDVLERFSRWEKDGLNSSINYCFDIGRQTLRSIQYYRHHGQPYPLDTELERAAGNGGLMRIAPVIGAYALANDQQAETQVVLSSHHTHPNKLASGAAKVMNAVMRTLIATEQPITSDELSRLIRKHSAQSLDELYQRVAFESLGEKPAEQISSSGYVVDSLEAALWAVVSTETFEDAVLKAVNLGDDADTVGAITGQIAGARYGAAAIPEHLTAGLYDFERIERKAQLIAFLSKQLAA